MNRKLTIVEIQCKINIICSKFLLPLHKRTYISSYIYNRYSYSIH